MKLARIVAHCQIKNEEVWIWHSLMSVLPHVDEIKVWDTGSNDTTVEIVKAIKNDKIKFKNARPTPDETSLAQVRQEMIDESQQFDWMMILDGDEVWPDASLKSVVHFIDENHVSYESIVTPTLNCLGDVYHVSPPDAGRYRLLGKVGHYNIRFINLRLPGLNVKSENGGLLSYYDSNDSQIQNRVWKKIAYLDAPYLHMTHLTRSQNRKDETSVFWRGVKRKYELGTALPNNFEYPTCFYFPRPHGVPSPFTSRTFSFWLTAAWQTPLRKLKRKFIP